MAVTQADINALDRAIADGVRSVTIGGTTTVYNTTDSLIRARDDLIRRKAQQDQEQAKQVRPARTYIYYSGRGY